MVAIVLLLPIVIVLVVMLVLFVGLFVRFRRRKGISKSGIRMIHHSTTSSSSSSSSSPSSRPSRRVSRKASVASIYPSNLSSSRALALSPPLGAAPVNASDYMSVEEVMRQAGIEVGDSNPPLPALPVSDHAYGDIGGEGVVTSDYAYGEIEVKTSDYAYGSLGGDIGGDGGGGGGGVDEEDGKN